MGNKNTEIWDRLGKTDKAHTSKFKRAGGFSGTAIKPIWSIHRMTEEFGPCGIGWGVNKPTFQVVHSSDEALVYCTVSIWHGSKENTVFGVGGDKAIAKNRNGTFTDDEAFKKAFTDAMTNAMKLIGVGADVHMGMFDDSKYVGRENPHVNHATDFHDEFSDDIPTVNSPKMKVKDARPEYEVMLKEMLRIQDPQELYEWGQAKAADIHAMPGEWPLFFKGEYTKHKQSLTNGKAA
jgi:hypothetical protein